MGCWRFSEGGLAFAKCLFQPFQCASDPSTSSSSTWSCLHVLKPKESAAASCLTRRNRLLMNPPANIRLTSVKMSFLRQRWHQVHILQGNTANTSESDSEDVNSSCITPESTVGDTSLVFLTANTTGLWKRRRIVPGWHFHVCGIQETHLTHVKAAAMKRLMQRK